eukprot:7825328-Alexandrium_andersonii.AAC.1
MFAELKRSMGEKPRVFGDHIFVKCRVLIKAEVQVAVEPAMARLVALESAMVIMQRRSQELRMLDGKRARCEDGALAASTAVSSRPSVPTSREAAPDCVR